MAWPAPFHYLLRLFFICSNLNFCSEGEVDRLVEGAHVNQLVGDVDDVRLVDGKLAFNATFLQGPVLT